MAARAGQRYASAALERPFNSSIVIKAIDGQKVLTVFQGPHAHVSPTFYATEADRPLCRRKAGARPAGNVGVGEALRKTVLQRLVRLHTIQNILSCHHHGTMAVIIRLTA